VPRLDGEALTSELAVADLLEGSLPRSLGFANRGGYERLRLGQAPTCAALLPSVRQPRFQFQDVTSGSGPDADPIAPHVVAHRIA
jgi:hypothetical protein